MFVGLFVTLGGLKPSVSTIWAKLDLTRSSASGRSDRPAQTKPWWGDRYPIRNGRFDIGAAGSGV